MMKLNGTQTVLIAEDSDDDYEVTVYALQRSGGLKNPLYRVENGQELLDYLNRQGHFRNSDHTLPGIILLDLNMPGIDGRSALREIKSESLFRKIPIVVLTTSDDEKDIQECYQDGANTYIQKPVDLDGFFRAIQNLKEYWFEIAILPR